MSSTRKRILVACFVMSILSLILNLAMLIVRIFLKFTGFDIGTITPSCASIPYLQFKLSIIYVVLRTDTILAAFSLTLAIPIFIFLLMEMRKPETSEGQQMAFVPLNRIYVLVSSVTLFQIANAGSALSLQVDNSSCPIVTSSEWTIIVIVAVSALLVSLTLLTLVIILAFLQRDTENPEQAKQSRQVQEEEQEMQRKFQQQAKQYLSSNYSQKDEFKQALLKNQHQLYGQPSGAPPQQQIQNKQQPLFATKEALMPDKNQQFNQDKPVLIKFNNLIAEQKQRKAQQLARLKQLQEETRLKNILFIVNDDNISEKFNEELFELREDLDRVIERESEEELSPLELKQLMLLTKADFKLVNSDSKAFHLQKKFSPLDEDAQDKYQINIKFAKIKGYKAHLYHNQSDEDDKKHQKKEDDNEHSKATAKPEESVSEQIKKMLKIILLNNSAFFKPPKHVQQECPISKYLQKDDKLDITQPNSQFPGKNKRIEYSKQEVVYAKKKERIEATESLQKAKIRQQFNEPQTLRIQREAAMGKEWVKQKREEQIAQGAPENKRRKRRVVQTIRSKYYL